jgi:hypothetical protein
MVRCGTAVPAMNCTYRKLEATKYLELESRCEVQTNDAVYRVLLVSYMVMKYAGPRKPHCFSVLSIKGASKTEFDWRSVCLVCAPITIAGYKTRRPRRLSMVGTWDTANVMKTDPMIGKTERALTHTHTHTHTRHTWSKNDVTTFTGPYLVTPTSIVPDSCLKTRIAHLLAVQSDMTALTRPTAVTTLYTTEHWDRGFDTRSGRACQPMLAVFLVGRADVHGVQ